MTQETKKNALSWLWFVLALLGMSVTWPLEVVFTTLEEFANIVRFMMKKMARVFLTAEMWLSKFTSPWVTDGNDNSNGNINDN